MTFPTWLELATKNLPTTVAMLVLTSVIYWRFFARRRVLPRTAARGKDRWRANAGLLAYLLVTSLLVFGYNYPVLQALRFESACAAAGDLKGGDAQGDRILPANVSEILIHRLHPMHQRPMGQPVIVRDPAALQAVIAAMQQSEPRRRVHEAFTIGYQLTFRVDGSDQVLDAKLLAFQLSNTFGPVQVVIPKIGQAGTEAYNSPALHAWLEATVLPEFVE